MHHEDHSDDAPDLEHALVDASTMRLEAGAVLSGGNGCEWVVGRFSADALPADGATKVIRRMLEKQKSCRPGPHHEPHVDVQTRVVQR